MMPDENSQTRIRLRRERIRRIIERNQKCPHESNAWLCPKCIDEAEKKEAHTNTEWIDDCDCWDVHTNLNLDKVTCQCECHLATEVR